MSASSLLKSSETLLHRPTFPGATQSLGTPHHVTVRSLSCRWYGATTDMTTNDTEAAASSHPLATCSQSHLPGPMSTADSSTTYGAVGTFSDWHRYPPHIGRQHLQRSGADLEEITSHDLETHVEITPLDSTHEAQVLKALEQCKKNVAAPFDYLLMFVGWRPLGYTNRIASDDGPGVVLKIVNGLLLLFLISALLLSYGYQMVACQWRLNLEDAFVTIGAATPLTPTQPSPTMNISSSPSTWSPNTEPPNTTPSPEQELTAGYRTYWCPLIPNHKPINSSSTLSRGVTNELCHNPTSACKHLVSTYVVPNLLHLMAYLIGFYHFRISGHENMHALMEKVFQSTVSAGPTSQRQVQRGLTLRLWLYLAAGAVWVASAVGTHVLYDLAFALYTDNTFAVGQITYTATLTLFSLDMMGYIIATLVTMTIILNYALTCDLIIFYVLSLTEKLAMRSIEISAVRKEMLMIKSSISHLNGAIGVMTACVLGLQLEMIIIGSIILVISPYLPPITRAYRMLFVFRLLPTLILPLIQAARVGDRCETLKRNAMVMRTYGYPENSEDELDSFLLFNMAIKFNVKLMKIPVKSSHLMALMVILLLAVMILSMVGLFGANSLF